MTGVINRIHSSIGSSGKGGADPRIIDSITFHRLGAMLGCKSKCPIPTRV